MLCLYIVLKARELLVNNTVGFPPPGRLKRQIVGGNLGNLVFSSSLDA